MRGDLGRYRLTYLLIVLNLIGYGILALWSGSFVSIDSYTLVEMGGLFYPLMAEHGEWWRLLSAIFLHGDMTHLLLNLFSLYLVGRAVESYFSPISYLLIYFTCALLGGLFSLLVHESSVGVGASGAIFGLFGALAGFFVAYRKEIGDYTRAFMKDFGIIIGINLLIGLSFESIDLSAHIAGLLTGMLGGFLISKSHLLRLLYLVLVMMLSIALLLYLSSRDVALYL
jgi:rhomboid protease GluP